MKPDPWSMADLTRLRLQLERADYGTESVRSAIGLDESVENLLSNVGRYSLLFVDKLAGIDSEAAVLGQLFLLGGTISNDRLHRLDRELIELLWSLGLAGLADESSEMVSGTVAITEYQGLYFLSDRLFENRSGNVLINERLDLCMPLHASSLELLAVLDPSTHGGLMLDVGCGSGCQSLLWASSYDFVTGIDINARSVSFARANALLNSLPVSYAVDDCRSYRDGRRYDQITFNSPDSATALAFINSSVSSLLQPTGTAHVWMSCEITESDVDWEGMIRNKMAGRHDLRVVATVNPASPFSLTPKWIGSRRLPFGTLVVPHPSKRGAYFDELSSRRVLEIVSVVLTISHSE